MRRKTKITLLSILTYFLLNIGLHAQEGLGTVAFKPEGLDVAQPYFNKGLCLLHSFAYKEAIEQFQTAQMLDPNFVMAYWGEAMCHYYPLWNSQNYEMGKGTLMKLGIFEEDRLSLAKNDLEKSLLKTVEILFNESKPEAERVANYHTEISKLITQFPENEEIAAFYALSLIGKANVENESGLRLEATKICKGILSKNPSHPGALNYIIFANESPGLAKNALNEAVQYAKVAAASKHALHAGSHIYYTLGKWDEGVNANKRAWEVTEKWVVANKLSLEDRDYHSLWWLQYGYLQQGQFEKAAGLVQDMYLDARMSDSKLTRYHLLSMKAAFIVNTEDWDHKINETEVPTKELNIVTKVADLFTKGLKAYHTNDVSRLNWVSGQITDMLSIERNKSKTISKEIFSTCGSELMNAVSSGDDLKKAEIMERQLLALVALQGNNPDKARELLESACEMEANSRFVAGPPVIVKSSWELFGEVLIKLGHYDEAVIQFNKSLERTPNRSLSLKGKYLALKQSGKTTEAAKVKTVLTENWKQADAVVRNNL